jgi:EF-P beta-lysylation protein EpmB
VLMILSGACAVHCRYCFRRHYPYHSAPKSLEHWQQAIDYIKHNPSITEVILSGGDPLMVTDQRLSELLQQFDAIPHLERLRIHTRLPVVIPQRIDRSFCDVVSGTRLATWVVLHINHANEIDNEVCAAVQRLKSAGAMVLNQAVLLNGINNTVDALTDLCQKLINIGVLPYYLHQLDRVSGAQHFEVDSAVGIELISELAKRLPGYAVPKYVSEIAGEPNKSPLGFATVFKLPE